MSTDYLSESDLLQHFESVLQSTNDWYRKDYQFTQGTVDGVHDQNVANWNEENLDSRAVGELSGAIDFGIDRDVMVLLHQESGMVTYELMELFPNRWYFPLDAKLQFNFFSDLAGGVRFRFLPHQAEGNSRLSVHSLSIRGTLSENGQALGKHLRDLAMSRAFVDGRLKGGGADKWSELAYHMAETGTQLGEIQVTNSGLDPMLEAIAASEPGLDWNVCPIVTLNSVLIWDSREKHSLRKFSEIEPSLGYVIGRSVVDGGRKIHGCLIRAMEFKVDETAQKIREIYASN